MKNKNRTLWILALIAMVNMLGYGIVFPVIYKFSENFGLSDFEKGLLFAIFSLCQFISTPIIGRLSDKFGRRPMLIISIIGTAVSFFMLVFAPNAIFLFIARALDGLTAGNIPVIFAVISDSTKPQDRAGAFGRIGAAFNFGFVIGPAIATLTVGVSAALPFIIAGVITMIAAALAILYLPETNEHMGEIEKKKLFDFKLMWNTLFDKNVGMIFIITLIFYFAFACAIVNGFQAFTQKVLLLSEKQNAMLFTLFGAIGLISQTFIVDRISKAIGMKKSFINAMIFTAVSFTLMVITNNVVVFIVGMILMAFANSIAQTLLPTILSQESDAKSQGSVMGLNASYQSIGMIFGPIVGGALITKSFHLPFYIGTLLVLVCYLLSFRAVKSDGKVQSAF